MLKGPGKGALEQLEYDDEWNIRAAMVLLDQALGIVPISIHGIIVDFESRMPWS